MKSPALYALTQQNTLVKTLEFMLAEAKAGRMRALIATWEDGACYHRRIHGLTKEEALGLLVRAQHTLNLEWDAIAGTKPE